MTDTDRVLMELRRAHPKGAHLHDLHARTNSLNVSQRIRDLRDRGFVITSQRERRNGRQGARYFLEVWGCVAVLGESVKFYWRDPRRETTQMEMEEAA